MCGLVDFLRTKGEEDLATIKGSVSISEIVETIGVSCARKEFGLEGCSAKLRYAVFAESAKC